MGQEDCKPDEHMMPNGCMKNSEMKGGSQGGRINQTGLIDMREATLKF
jgi:hypothetical protein